jgi:2-polyprenyl-6-hydroxyphenyl methylase/3-demethylubiquinone-9 3-methyltransferase
MLEHVPEPASVIASCAKLLKPGGQLFVSTINRTAKAYLFAIVGAEYVLKLLPKGTHEYAKFIKPSEIANWARQSELNLEHSIGMHYNPLTKHYKLAPGLEVNYLMHLTRSS